MSECVVGGEGRVGDGWVCGWVFVTWDNTRTEKLVDRIPRTGQHVR